MLYSVLYGIAVGAGRSLYGFDKAKGADFDWQKFIKTMVIGGVIGGAAAFAGMSFEAMSASTQSWGLLTAIEFGATAVANVVLKRVGGLLGLTKKK